MKRIMLATACLTAVAAISLPAAAHGARGGMGHPGPGAEFMKQIDTDGDGKISDAEKQAFRDAMFAEIDTNKDGVISQDEMTAHHEAKKAEMQAKFAERKAERVDRMFETFDTNKDGMISREEVTAHEATMDAEREQKMAEWKAKRAEDGKDFAADRFAAMDTDGDGTISKAEFDAARMDDHGRRGKGRGPGRWMKKGDMPPAPPAPDGE